MIHFSNVQVIKQYYIYKGLHWLSKMLILTCYNIADILPDVNCIGKF